VVTDVVELFFHPAGPEAAGSEAAAADGAALLARILDGQAPYFAESLAQPLRPLSEKPVELQVVAQEQVSVGGEEGGASFMAVIAAAPGSSALRVLAKDGVEAMAL
jgi:hypothetical protein